MKYSNNCHKLEGICCCYSYSRHGTYAVDVFYLDKPLVERMDTAFQSHLPIIKVVFILNTKREHLKGSCMWLIYQCTILIFESYVSHFLLNPVSSSIFLHGILTPMFVTKTSSLCWNYILHLLKTMFGSFILPCFINV